MPLKGGLVTPKKTLMGFYMKKIEVLDEDPWVFWDTYKTTSSFGDWKQLQPRLEGIQVAECAVLSG